MKSFKEFIAAYHDGSIQEDASWRAYDIPTMTRGTHTAKAAARLGYASDGISIGQLATDYGLPHARSAMGLLALWYVWSGIAGGTRKRALKKESINEHGHTDLH